MKKLIVINLLFFPCLLLFAQKSYTISGYVKDIRTGESLIGANIFDKGNPLMGTDSNMYGFYSLTLKEGMHELAFTFLGYQDQIYQVDLSKNIRHNIELVEGVTIEEIVVTNKKSSENIQSTSMGTADIPLDNIQKLPNILGEADIMKIIQLLPGVQSATEGNSGFYIRGGGPDQNLVLMDDAVVYNPGHMLGLYSVFNPDAIRKTNLIKGGMPANYGGRLSSVVDVQMKDGNFKTYNFQGGIGLVASRLTLEGPLQKDKSSFIISGRRSYLFELSKPLIARTNFAGTNYFFYDLNAKINHRLTKEDRIYFSIYTGKDFMNYYSGLRDVAFQIPYGNTTATIRWNRRFRNKLFMNISAIYNDYKFEFNGGQGDYGVNINSGVRDYNMKIDFDYYPNPNNHFQFGLNSTLHRLTPKKTIVSENVFDFKNTNETKYGLETSAYILDDIELSPKVALNVGLRLSVFSHLLPFIPNVNKEQFRGFKSDKTYWGLEPRISSRFLLSKTDAIKAGLSYTNQYIHLVSSSTSTLPLDIWLPSSALIKPQKGIQYALGYFKNFGNDKFEFALEMYYKQLKNQIDYQETYVDNPILSSENEFVFGDGRSYGLELFLKKRFGILNGWIGYTLSRSERTFPDINDGLNYPVTYDRTHDLSVVLNYKLNKRLELGGTYVFSSGNTFTPIESLFIVEKNLNIAYGNRNSSREEPYHRLDLSATLNFNTKPGKPFKSYMVFSVYNVYNRKNIFFRYNEFETNLEKGTAKSSAYKVSLFPIIPSFSWNFALNKASTNKD